LNWCNERAWGEVEEREGSRDLGQGGSIRGYRRSGLVRWSSRLDTLRGGDQERGGR
jgi:hypothetical protein